MVDSEGMSSVVAPIVVLNVRFVLRGTYNLKGDIAMKCR